MELIENFGNSSVEMTEKGCSGSLKETRKRDWTTGQYPTRDWFPFLSSLIARDILILLGVESGR